MTANATYLYAITRPLPPDAVVGLRGVGGAQVRVLEHGEISGLASTVDRSEFGDEPRMAHLENLDWLARTARQHDDVVRAASRIVTTMPLRMATVCHDDDAAAALLDGVRDTALAVLPELDGRDEWGVKVYALPTSDAVDAVAEEAATGAEYLMQRRRQLARHSSAFDTAARDAETALARLAEVAAATRRHPPQDQRLSGVPHPMVLNAAFLVGRADEDAFRALVTQSAERFPPGALALTGPWPPYSFIPSEDL